MKIDLSGRTAIVTGSTAGIGLATARLLAQSGARVVVCGRDEAHVERTTAGLRADEPGADLIGIAADVTTKNGAEALIEAVPDCDILINNLGIYRRQDFFDLPDEEWQRFFDVNVMSGVRLSRHYAQGMRARQWGRVVFVSSESALQIPADMVHYGFTKAGQLAVARGLAESLAATGVTVNSVLPGPTRTDGVNAMWTKAAADQGVTFADIEAAFFRTARPSSLLRRLAEPEEIAALIVYLSSPQASATTGAALRVDGGIVRSIA